MDPKDEIRSFAIATLETHELEGIGGRGWDRSRSGGGGSSSSGGGMMIICVETEFDGHPGSITDKSPSAFIVWFFPIRHAHERLYDFDAFPRFLKCT